MEREQNFHLRWNNYNVTVGNVFKTLYCERRFCDVTIAAKGKSFKCHKIVLATCSPYFDNLLEDYNSHPQPVFILDIPAVVCEALITFMYIGQVEISQANLPQLLTVADTLKVKGLADVNAMDAIPNHSTSRMMENYCRNDLPPRHNNMPPAIAEHLAKIENRPYNNQLMTKPLAFPHSTINNQPRNPPMQQSHPKNQDYLFQVAGMALQQLKNQNHVNENSKPHKKRRLEEDASANTAASLPPSPPFSNRASPPSDRSQSSPEAYNDVSKFTY